MSLHKFLIVSFEKTGQKLGLRASSRVPNTSKQMKALDLRPRAFICFSVFGTRDEALALVFDILLEDEDYFIDICRIISKLKFH